MTPRISGKYHCQLDLKGRHLPVTFTMPDIPDMLPPEEPIVPGHSPIVTDKENDSTAWHYDTLVISQQPQSVLAYTLSTTAPSPDTNSHIKDPDQLSLLSVSVFPFCALSI
jgi:hypothetical protein